MIFEQDSQAFQILDVLYIEQGQAKTYNQNRNFDAVSFRIEADTLIEFNGKEVEAGTNSICYFPSNTNYIRETQRDKMIVVHFKSFNYHSDEIEIFNPESPEKYSALFAQILDCWNKKDTSYKLEASAILNMIFAETYRDNKSEEIIESKIFPGIKHIKENCYKRDFSLSEAARQAMLSEPYFRKLFKKEYGISPKQYVINRRIKHAASMIIAGYYHLEDISLMCGYNDYKHFSVEFKKLMGVSPSKYKYIYAQQGQ